MREIKSEKLTGERALYGEKNLKVTDCVFVDGESPIKECENIELENCLFQYKYPVWYSNGIKLKDCKWYDMARAGVWYAKDVEVEKGLIQAPKNFRRCTNLKLKDVTMTGAAETLWNCENVSLSNVTAKGDYFAMNCKNVKAENLTLDGNYSFDGAENIEIHNSTLLSRDAFWNCKNVTVYDSFISGEYLGWNSENVTLINCTIESLQGMCYIDKLVMKNCKLMNTTLAFEYSEVEAEISGEIESVLNPKSGMIKADRIGELIIEKDLIQPEKTIIRCEEILNTRDRAEWR